MQRSHRRVRPVLSPYNISVITFVPMYCSYTYSAVQKIWSKVLQLKPWFTQSLTTFFGHQSIKERTYVHRLHSILNFDNVTEASQFRGSMKLDIRVSFFEAGLLRTISSQDYPQQEGTKYYAKLEDPGSNKLQGTIQVKEAGFTQPLSETIPASPMLTPPTSSQELIRSVSP